MNPLDWLVFLSELADRADGIALRLFRSKTLKIEEKADLSLVTEADLQIEETLRIRVRERHPDLEVFGEEYGEDGRAGGRRLIVDPIDATANFARGIPIFATLMAIEDGDEIIAGMVSAPGLHGRWSAARGGGAFAGNQRIAVSGIRELSRAQVFHGSLAGLEAVAITRRIPDLIARTARQRGFGDFYQHVLVADGAGEIAVDPIVNPWDIAPLLILIEEAGGRATSVGGERSIYKGSLVTSNGLLHDDALAVLAADGPEPA